jgi:hypothetical protein
MRSRYGGVNGQKIRMDLSYNKQRTSDAEVILKAMEEGDSTAIDRAVERGWILPGEEFDPHTLTKETMAQLAWDIRAEAGMIDDPLYPLHKRMHAMISDLYRYDLSEYLAKNLPKEQLYFGDPMRIPNRELWMQIPGDKRYGQLAGAYVPRHIGEELVGFPQRMEEIAGALESAMSVIKWGKVATDSSVVTQNLMSNISMGWLMGVKPSLTARGVLEYINALRGQDSEVYKAMRSLGLFRHTFGERELAAFARELQLNPRKTPLQNLIEAVGKNARKPGEWYGAIEDAFKMGAAMQILDDAGMLGKSAEEIMASPVSRQAREFAQRTYIDYSQTSKAVALGRRSVTPFITFVAKVAPRMLEVAIKNPWKIPTLYALYEGINMFFRTQTGLTRKETQEMQDKNTRGEPVIFTSFKDGNGQYISIPIGRGLPFTAFTRFATTAAPRWMGGRGDSMGAVGDMAGLGGPIAIGAQAISNTNTFTGRPIATENMTDTEKRMAYLNWLTQQIVPTQTPLIGAGWQRAGKAFSDDIVESSDRFGMPRSKTNEVVRNLTGFRYVPVSPDTTGLENKMVDDLGYRRTEFVRPLVDDMKKAMVGDEAAYNRVMTELEKQPENVRAYLMESLERSAKRELQREMQQNPAAFRVPPSAMPYLQDEGVSPDALNRRLRLPPRQ